jgi:hypothetical protein
MNGGKADFCSAADEEIGEKEAEQLMYVCMYDSKSH